MQEYVSAPSIWLRVTPTQEAADLEQWRQRRLAEERRHGEYLEQLECDAEEEQREAEEEAHQTQAATAQPATAQPVPDINIGWNTAFP